MPPRRHGPPALLRLLLPALLAGARGASLRGVDLCAEDGVALLQTEVSWAPGPGARDAALQLGAESRHAAQMRTAGVIVLVVFAVYLAFQCTGLGRRLYEWSFDDKAGSQPRTGPRRLVMQFASLTWKNILTNTRTEVPGCCKLLNGCCVQMFCPLFYIALLTAVPCSILRITGQDKAIAVDFPMDYGRDYSDPNLVLPPSMGDYLYSEPKASAIADASKLAEIVSRPLQTLWHPRNMLPQGACFCRTLGIVGPGAAEFQSFAQQHYAAWAERKSAQMAGTPAQWLDRGAARLSCPSNYTGTLFRVFSSTAEVDRLMGSVDYALVRPQRSLNINDRLCGLVVLENDPVTSPVPKFAVRTNISGMDLMGLVSQKRWDDDAKGIDTRPLAWYLQSGFLSIQDLVQRYVSHARVGDNLTLPEPSFVPLPSAPYHQDRVKEGLSRVIADPSTATNTFTVTIMLIAYFMIRERNSRQKELMRLMGLYDSSLVLSWIMLFALMNLVCSLGCSVLVYAALIEKSDFVIVFLIFYLSSLATITLGMVISSLFTSDRLGALLAFAVYNVLGLIYHTCVPGGSVAPDQREAERAEEASPLTLYMVSIFPNIAFTLSMKTYFALDRSRTGSTLRHLYKVHEHFSVGGGLAMLVFDIFFWGLVHAYLDQIVPHDVGTVRPWYFPATPGFWRECCGLGAAPALAPAPLEGQQPTAQEDGLFESEDTAQLQQLRQRNSTVAVRGLHKTFVNASGAEIHAVNGLSLTMYLGECFCLLGHNGAGKTTAMGMLTGMLEPTAGEIRVFGLKMPEDAAEIRKGMGFCMQQNVLWDTLTVREHVTLFGALMGLTPSATEESIGTVLERVELTYKQDAWASALSGGMKRKLNVALALVGDARVLLLDEPTAGMDPHTRRRLWGVLKRSRPERIMCLTTHYMDEADELGDRVCIMVHGRAACNGTNAFLKHRLGCGYLLNFVKVAEDVADEPVEAVVRAHCGEGVSKAASVGRELRLRVPFPSAPHFPAMMRELDGGLGALGLESYGVGVSDLEDVFLRVANGEQPRAMATGPGAPAAEGAPGAPGAPAAVAGGAAGAPSPAEDRGPTLAGQLAGLLGRRVRYGLRDSHMFCCQLLIPVVLLLVFLGISQHKSRDQGVYGRSAVDTAGWGLAGDEGFGPTLVTVGLAENSSKAARSLAHAWTVGRTPGVSHVVLNTSVQIPPSARTKSLPASRDRERFSEEMAFASFAYRITRGDSYDGGRISGVPQFGGVLYSDDRVTLFPNTSAYYTGPALFNLHFTAAMKSVQAEGAPDHVEIINAPLPASEAELRFLRAVSTLAMALTVMSAYSFIATGIAGYVVMEREKEVKHQLMVSGTTRFAYWLSNFVFDSIFGLFSCVSTLIILAIFGGSTWCTFPNINATVALLLLFVPAVNAFAYFWSHFFETSGGALVGVLMLNLFLGSFGLQISYALLFFPKTRLAGRIILWVTRALLPSVCVGDGLLNLALYKDISRMLGLSPFSGFIFGSEYCAPENAGMPCIANAGDDCIMLVFSAALYSFLFTAADWISEHPGCRFRLSPDPICPWELRRQEDENVRAEKARVAKLDPSTQVLMVDGVSKVYTSSRGAVHAVRGVSFAVDAGNVFGLLGTNGAGKTTTFKMICGQLPPSSGRIFVKGLDVSEDLQGVRSHIGYCPQFDALLEHMTVREHLELFARVKGFGGPALEAECLEKQRTLRLEEYADSRAGQLSGGNKRKLQTAIALVGEPEVVFLDEPSAGMDPLARRRMWDVIQRVAMSRRSSAVVLTTHSMEEADALCTRIGIQCSGQLRCLGSPQQLKEWYGTGLELNLRLEPPTHPEGARLCRDWGVGPEEALRLGQAQQFVDCFFANRKLDPRGPPLKGETDSMVAAALAEWCLQEERAEGLAAFLEQTCGGKDKAACVERAAGSARYRLSGDCPGGGPRPYAELFERLEEQRGPLRLADFQLSQGTLEQTFNRLAAEDIALREEDDPDGGDHT